jgi:hypothetical protein
MKARSGMTDVLGYGRYATGEHVNILKEVARKFVQTRLKLDFTY